MTKILMSLMTIALVSLVSVGATRAAYSDTETSNGNTFAAGTLDLNLNGGNTDVALFSVSNAAPGDTGGATWIVHNVGSIPGYLDLHTIAVTDDDNGCTEPEGLEDATCGAGEGELSANTVVDVFADTNNNGVHDAGETTIYSGALGGIAANYPDLDLALAADGTHYIRMNWEIPAATGNIIQSDSSTLAMTFELGQTTAQ
ncbi:CalY family protein [Patescibacteria group bacterium]|nr:CalY family protein [Patescibacteria group bacterium]